MPPSTSPTRRSASASSSRTCAAGGAGTSVGRAGPGARARAGRARRPPGRRARRRRPGRRRRRRRAPRPRRPSGSGGRRSPPGAPGRRRRTPRTARARGRRAVQPSAQPGRDSAVHHLPVEPVPQPVPGRAGTKSRGAPPPPGPRGRSPAGRATPSWGRAAGPALRPQRLHEAGDRLGLDRPVTTATTRRTSSASGDRPGSRATTALEYEPGEVVAAMPGELRRGARSLRAPDHGRRSARRGRAADAVHERRYSSSRKRSSDSQRTTGAGCNSATARPGARAASRVSRRVAASSGSVVTPVQKSSRARLDGSAHCRSSRRRRPVATRPPPPARPASR